LRCLTTLVYSIYDSTEVAIQKMIEGIQRTITIGNQTESLSRMNPAIKKHLELEIKTLLQNAPRDADKLEGLLKAKEEMVFSISTPRLSNGNFRYRHLHIRLRCKH
jgi:hypothetical protein